MQTNEPIDAEALLATPIPPVRWIIPDLLPAGLSLLAGASKTGKERIHMPASRRGCSI